MDMPGLDLRGGSGSIADCSCECKSPSRVPANGLSGLVPLALATTGLMVLVLTGFSRKIG